MNVPEKYLSFWPGGHCHEIFYLKFYRNAGDIRNCISYRRHAWRTQMTVWLVYTSPIKPDEFAIVGVYSTEERAKRRAEQISSSYWIIESVIVDKDYPDVENLQIYTSGD